MSTAISEPKITTSEGNENLRSDGVVPPPDVILRRISSEFCLTYVTVHFWDGKFQVPAGCGLFEISEEVEDIISRPVWSFLRTCKSYREARRCEGQIRQWTTLNGYRFRDGVYAIPSSRFNRFVSRLRLLEQEFLQACSHLADEWLEKIPEIRERLEAALSDSRILNKIMAVLPSDRESFLNRFSVEYGVFVHPGKDSGLLGSLSDRLGNLIALIDQAEACLGAVEDKHIPHSCLLHLEDLSDKLAEARLLAEKTLEMSRGGIVRSLQRQVDDENLMQEVLNQTSQHYLAILQQILREPIERLIEGLHRLSLTAQNQSCRRTTLENLRRLIDATLEMSRWFSPRLRESILSLQNTLVGSSAQDINSMSESAIRSLQNTVDNVLRQCESELQDDLSRVRVFRFLEDDPVEQSPSDMALV